MLNIDRTSGLWYNQKYLFSSYVFLTFYIYVMDIETEDVQINSDTNLSLKFIKVRKITNLILVLYPLSTPV